MKITNSKHKHDESCTVARLHIHILLQRTHTHHYIFPKGPNLQAIEIKCVVYHRSNLHPPALGRTRTQTEYDNWTIGYCGEWQNSARASSGGTATGQQPQASSAQILWPVWSMELPVQAASAASCRHSIAQGAPNTPYSQIIWVNLNYPNHR